ncbi:hypothetical protein BRC88_02880 [Halobacteriales archaeon QS_4_69_225]|nr:MAG: hypothetical protein BRC88_02880 [Halobacteriales archaeon QS_4_69_225]
MTGASSHTKSNCSSFFPRRIAVLNSGELQQIGTPFNCYHQPQNRFVAGFIGSPKHELAKDDCRRQPSRQ